MVINCDHTILCENILAFGWVSKENTIIMIEMLPTGTSSLFLLPLILARIVSQLLRWLFTYILIGCAHTKWAKGLWVCVNFYFKSVAAANFHFVCASNAKSPPRKYWEKNVRKIKWMCANTNTLIMMDLNGKAAQAFRSRSIHTYIQHAHKIDQ